jgi:plasmid stabilization system protein ParE
MKVVYTAEALRNLDGILGFIAERYPKVTAAFENRLRAAVMRIGAWPESAPMVADRPEVRVLPLIPYPYKLFYRVTADAVEILYLHHAARREPWQNEG